MTCQEHQQPCPETEQQVSDPTFQRVGDVAQDLLGNQAIQQVAAGMVMAPTSVVGMTIAQHWDAIKETASNWWDETQSSSDDWFAVYRSKNPQDRISMAREEYNVGRLDDIISDLPLHQAKEEYQDELGEVLDMYQDWETTSASEMTPDQLIQTQSDFMYESARQDAQEASGSNNPTATEIEEAHQDSVADQDYIVEPDSLVWDALSQAERDQWTARGNAAINAVLDHMKTNHPELDYDRTDLVLAFRQVEAYGAVAYTDGKQCFLGMDFVTATEQDPAFAVSTIVHEMEGHPEFDSGYSVSFALYDLAAQRMPGYTRPAEGSEDREAEWDRYGYFESEIGALLRELPYDRPTDSQGNENPLGSSLPLLNNLLFNMSEGLAPELEQPMMEGLKNRFEVDPRISPETLVVFIDAVNRNTGATL